MRHFTKSRLLQKPLLASAIAMAISFPASADDTDVFDAIGAAQVKPSILFLLDYSGSMKQDVDNNKIQAGDTATESKLTVLKTAVNSLLDDNVGKINVGIGSMFQGHPSGVKWPISDLDADAHTIDPSIPKDEFKVVDMIRKQLDSAVAERGTPTIRALAEAAAYFRGDPYTNNDRTGEGVEAFRPHTWNDLEKKYTGGDLWSANPVSYDQTKGFTDGTPATWLTPNYKQPDIKECQQNFIVLISDGNPSGLGSGGSALDTVLGAAGVGGRGDCASQEHVLTDSAPQHKDGGDCGIEIVDYLYNNDMNPAIPGSNVKTFTVGFSLENDDGTPKPGAVFLKNLADASESEFYQAAKPEELTDALEKIIDSVLGGNRSFAELSIDVDNTSYSHENSTYLSLFTPSGSDSWQGNLKGYFLDTDGLIDIHGQPAITKEADYTSFTQTSQSFWSTTPDGNEVLEGGASALIENRTNPANRNMYTNLTGPGSGLFKNANRIEVGNTAVANQMAAGSDAAIDWLASAPMGDPLHTKPVLVKYSETERVVFGMTNQGFLHAFNATTPVLPDAANPDISGGQEIFAFMPKELLKNIPALHAPTSTGNHLYGLDGGITRWHDDKNGNGIVDIDNNETMLLIFGMRRGGTSYYALNVTDPYDPVFEWQISPGGDFDRLAQTWSKPALVNVNHGGDDRQVLMFSGGYDAANVDGSTGPVAGAKGNAIYMVDINGQHVWSVDGSDDLDMNYSIASDLTVIDSDSNGRADRVYVGDQAGQMWRVDFDDVSTSADTTLTLLADVSDGHQPIFYAPSVSLNRDNGDTFLSVAFGTGDRTDPLDPTSRNAFYMIRDFDYAAGPPDSLNYTKIEPHLLTNVTDLPVDRTDLENSYGWVMYLKRGEKSLSEVETFEGKFLATTSQPGDPETGLIDPCNFQITGRLYIMDVLDATPIKILDDGSEQTEGLTAADRSSETGSGTLDGKPQIKYSQDSDEVGILVGKELQRTMTRDFKTVFWHAK